MDPSQRIKRLLIIVAISLVIIFAFKSMMKKTVSSLNVKEQARQSKITPQQPASAVSPTSTTVNELSITPTLDLPDSAAQFTPEIQAYDR